jgi:hypothetical protein
MNWSALVLALLGTITGVIAAWYWYRASRVKLAPAWETDIHGDVSGNMMSWVTGTMQAFKRSSDLNARAARWTAASVLLNALSAVIQLLT